MLIFLLTANGVRGVEVDLDFLKGIAHDERRTSFRYDALASAQVVEEGVQSAQNTDLNRRTFTVTLLDGADIEVVVSTDYTGLYDATTSDQGAAGDARTRVVRCPHGPPGTGNSRRGGP